MNAKSDHCQPRREVSQQYSINGGFFGPTAKKESLTTNQECETGILNNCPSTSNTVNCSGLVMFYSHLTRDFLDKHCAPQPVRKNVAPLELSWKDKSAKKNLEHLDLRLVYDQRYRKQNWVKICTDLFSSLSAWSGVICDAPWVKLIP